MSKTEQWKQIPGAMLGYEASDHGNIRDPKGNPRPLWRHPSGYYQSTIKREDGSNWHTVTHVFVAAAFYGPAPDGMEVAHGDHDKKNNRPSNLRYVTHTENMNDGHPRNGPSSLPWDRIEVGASFVTRAHRAQAEHYAVQNGRRFNRKFSVEEIGRKLSRVTRLPMLGGMTCSASANVGGPQ